MNKEGICHPGVQAHYELVLETAQLQEVVLGVAPLRGGAGDLALRVDEIARVEGAPAVVALVAAGVLIAAVRAGAVDVAVG